MVEGDLHRFLDKKFEGDIIYTSAFPNKPLGGLTLSRETIPLDLVPPTNAELEYALLEVGVQTHSTSIEWRVKVNGINITKEFKPVLTANLRDKLLAKLIYDITSILRRPEALRRNRVNITFKREGGKPIIIEHIGLVALFKAPEASSSIKYYSGVLSLEPGEKAGYSIGFTGENPTLKSAVYIPSRQAQMMISVNGSEHIELTNIQGLSEVVKELRGVNRVDTIEFLHHDTGERYAPRQVRVYNLLLHSTTYAKPELNIESIDVPREADKEVTAKIVIKNKGDSKPDKALLVVMCFGNVVFNTELEPLDPGASTLKEIKFSLPPGEYETVFRVIWRKLTRMWYKDFRIKLKVK